MYTALMVPATLSLDDFEGMLPAPRTPVRLDDMERAIRQRGD